MYACLSVFVCPTDGIRGYENWMVYCRKRFFFLPPLFFSSFVCKGCLLERKTLGMFCFRLSYSGRTD